jgi:hypothetical protein
MVAIVNGCVPREVHAEGEEKVEHNCCHSCWVCSERYAVKKKKKQFSIEHVIQSVFSSTFISYCVCSL